VCCVYGGLWFVGRSYNPKRTILLKLTMCLANIPTTLAPFITFLVYAIIAAVKKDETVLSAQAFASLSLISLLTSPLLTFCQALPTFFQAVSFFDRIDAYLSKQPASMLASPPSSQSLAFPPDQTELRNLGQPPVSTGIIISFSHADIAWSRTSKLVLQDLSLDIRPGFTAITGSVAAGKSTLIWSMIGETTLKRGSMRPQILSGVAFCSQTPWVMDEKIRENITGGLDFDQKWYDYSVSCCGLEEDLARMPGGDQAIAGINGSSLSGGERQRIVSCPGIHIYLRLLEAFEANFFLSVAPGSCSCGVFEASNRDVG
jgi:ATP-binding cassette subfamily C (CFTR/MRP) protein 1